MTGARDLLTGTDLALNFAEIPTVFIRASAQPGTLDIGVTRDFWSRVPEHRPDLRNGSQSATALHLMGYHEMHDDMTAAIRREKQLKKWHRAWKIRQSEQMNLEWRALWDEAQGPILDGPADASRERR